MKKKIVSFLIVMLMLISITPFALAASIKLPEIPMDEGDYFVFQYKDTYEVIYSTKHYKDPDTVYDFLTFDNSRRYELVGSKWVYTGGQSGRFMSALVYDSTGSYLTDNVVAFVDIVNMDDVHLYYQEMAKQINVPNIVQIIVVGAGACVGLVFLYWGCCKGVKALMSAFKKGKVSL